MRGHLGPRSVKRGGVSSSLASRKKSVALSVPKDYDHLFKRSVHAEPANVPPFKIHLRADATWHTSKSNHNRPRPLTDARATALREQINKVVKLGLVAIESSRSLLSSPHGPEETIGLEFHIQFLRAQREHRSHELADPQYLRDAGSHRTQVSLVLCQDEPQFRLSRNAYRGGYQAPSQLSSPCLGFPFGLFEWSHPSMGRGSRFACEQ